MHRASAGFTLAELLISLAIVALMASFSISKILIAADDVRMQTSFKELYSTLSAIAYQGILENVFRPGSDWGCGGVTNSCMGNYIVDHINAVKICQQVRTDGCWTWDYSTETTGAVAADYAGLVMHSGATLVFGAGLWYNSPDWGSLFTVVIDANGSRLTETMKIS